MYVSPSFFDGGSTGLPGLAPEQPGEYAEYAISLLRYLRTCTA